ncbi:MAG: hypothetical protein B6244_07570 [Candidatus Cloacimonetes bacterium 4572_55]|nr:MAG: hypothetical protein B6244_07570 [Candidatus Cloacimonetes bacterium 4572_55]
MATYEKELRQKQIYSDSHKTQIVVFCVQNEEYGIHINKVLEISELVSIVRMPRAPHFVEGVINLRNLIVPIIDLHKRFNLPPRENTPATSITIIDGNEGNRAGFIVDEVKEVISLSVDQIDEKPMLLNQSIGSDFIAGVGRLDQRLIILLDIDNILKVSSDSQ